jgi:hypothetical protein
MVGALVQNARQGQPRELATNSPIGFPLPLTPTDIQAVKRALAGFPVGWFNMRVVAQENSGGFHRFNYVMLQQTWGPRLGAEFRIGRTNGRYVVSYGERNLSMDDWSGAITVEEAMAWVKRFILDTLNAWGIPPV